MYEVFEDLCLKRGVTAYRVSKDTGISTATLTAWKQGKYEPKDDKLQLIADYFGVTVKYIKTGEAEEGYYINPETAKAAQEIFENKELRLLFDEARDADPEDLKTVHAMLLALKKKERGET